MAKFVLLVLAFCLVLVSSASAQNATNSTNSTEYNFSLTECTEQCINSSMDWTVIFACDSGVPGVMYACCNNKTLCDIRFNTTCSNIVHIVPAVLPPAVINDSDDGNGSV